MTDKGMPEKVTGWKPKDGSVYFYDPNPEWLARQSEDEVDVIHMIRADIVEELVRAMEYEKERGRLSVSSQTILTRINAIMEGK